MGMKSSCLEIKSSSVEKDAILVILRTQKYVPAALLGFIPMLRISVSNVERTVCDVLLKILVTSVPQLHNSKLMAAVCDAKETANNALRMI